ncbi:hypothetical protein [Dechloromonas hortensis]|uniref:hypothetical protein n=1 Tax=Dechloromonas hortensis TaxID=337779 RepID=UPI0012913626|nr:hypothetical protein [Dechloromonas hortensis]
MHVPQVGHDADWQAVARAHSSNLQSTGEKIAGPQHADEAAISGRHSTIQHLASETARLQRRLAELYPALARSQQSYG